MTAILNATDLHELQHTLDTLATPIATVRRIVFAGTPRQDPTPVVTGVAQALAKIPGRRVLVQPATPDPDWLNQQAEADPETIAALPEAMRAGVRLHSERVLAADADLDPKHCDITCVNAGVVTHPDEIAALAAHAHLLCLVTGTQRAEADPTLALAAAVDENPTLAASITCMVPDSGERGSRWTRLVTRALTDRVVYVRESRDVYALHRLAGMALSRSLGLNEHGAKGEHS